MRRFLVWTGALLLLGALGTGVWWAWPILFPSLPAGWLSTLAKADAALIQGRPDRARVLLEKTPASLPVEGWLQWEKRVNGVAEQTGAWKWASLAAAAAHTQFPGNTDLAAYLVWTLLKDGRPDEAQILAQKVLLNTPWSGLALQAAVEAGGLAQGDWSGLSSTLAEPGPAAFKAYQALSALSPDASLQKNALLTALEEGHMDEARRHLDVLTPAQRDSPPFDVLQGLMAYDQGDWPRAAALLKTLANTRPETLLVLADVYLHLGTPEQAGLIYDQLLADHPDAPPLPLVVNRATLYLDAQDAEGALALLTRAQGLGSEASLGKVRLLSLEARFRLGETDAVRQALDKLTRGEETSAELEAELLKGRLFPDLSSAPLLSSLLHRHPEFSPLAERLAWLKMVEQDDEGAERVLALHDAALKKQGLDTPWWAILLTAYLRASEDRLDESSRAFEAIPPAWRDATYYANWALVGQLQAQRAEPDARKPFLEDALQRLTKALDILPQSAAHDALVRRSLWLTRKGELQTALLPLQLPDKRGALRSSATENFRQAVQLDPDNLKASFLLRQSAQQDNP